MAKETGLLVEGRRRRGRPPLPKDKAGARRLYREMCQKGWSEWRLCQESGVAYKTIRGVLDAGRRPSLRVQHDLADALGIADPSRIWHRLPLERRAA